MQFLFSIFCVLFISLEVRARLAGECATLCNDLRFEVLTLEMCRDARRTLPRPKVGDFCSNAMEQGFSDSCVALCMDERPIPRVAQTCRAAAIEMPRPTVRRWCEHGYNVAFEKTTADLRNHFKQDTVSEPAAVVQEPVVEEVKQPEIHTGSAADTGSDADPVDHHVPEEVRAAAEAAASGLRGGGAARAVIHTIPITIEDEEKELLVHEGQNAEEAVVEFCRQNVPDDVSSCIRQLLSTVIEKMEEGSA